MLKTTTLQQTCFEFSFNNMTDLDEQLQTSKVETIVQRFVRNCKLEKQLPDDLTKLINNYYRLGWIELFFHLMSDQQ